MAQILLFSLSLSLSAHKDFDVDEILPSPSGNPNPYLQTWQWGQRVNSIAYFVQVFPRHEVDQVLDATQFLFLTEFTVSINLLLLRKILEIWSSECQFISEIFY